MGKIKGWDKISDTSNQEVWSNGSTRVVVAKGKYMWTVWYEKNIGKIGSDQAFIRNAYLGIQPTKDDARKLAVSYMKNIPLNDDEKAEVLTRLGKDTHYLMMKPISDWDEYDKSNWDAITSYTIFDKRQKSRKKNVL